LLDQLIHDLKNPLGVMMSFAEEIPSATDEERSHFCNRLIVNARRAIQVLDDFALLADLRRAGVEVHKTEHDWATLVEEGLREVNDPDTAPRLGLAAKTGRVRADPVRLRHAVAALARETLHRVRRPDAVHFDLDCVASAAILRVTVQGRHEEDPERYPFDVETVPFELARRVAVAHGGSLSFETRDGAAVATLALPR
jgi:light-regulated signal transduction histidine kinase (bacteriophytochrome)